MTEMNDPDARSAAFPGGAPDGATTGKPKGTPDFALSHPDHSLRAQEMTATYTDPTAAGKALRDGTARLVVGAIPFDSRRPWALGCPARVVSGAGPLEPPSYYRSARLPHFSLSESIPARAEHRDRVAAAVEVLESGELDKVVLARREVYSADGSFDSRTLAARLMSANPSGYGFLADLSPAGSDFAGHYLVGSSPELLVRKSGTRVSSFPLAGSAARSADAEEDERIAEKLFDSAKDLREHRYVVEHITSVLERFGVEVHAPERPELLSTRELWHLGTPITAKVTDPEVTALELAAALHPTPALGGTPAAGAVDYILSEEEDRRFYGGAVGWCDARGDGTYMVSIRCGETDELNKKVSAWGGGGIISASDPDAELRETEVKLGTIRRSLGL
ncbi:isochorismate synthase [Dietzia sp.]|uniref:isochorismate synthase n=1 Tax=Dietzia sp. TaxID=1871616 RepID=UPI002FD928AE